MTSYWAAATWELPALFNPITPRGWRTGTQERKEGRVGWMSPPSWPDASLQGARGCRRRTRTKYMGHSHSLICFSLVAGKGTRNIFLRNVDSIGTSKAITRGQLAVHLHGLSAATAQPHMWKPSALQQPLYKHQCRCGGCMLLFAILSQKHSLLSSVGAAQQPLP